MPAAPENPARGAHRADLACLAILLALVPLRVVLSDGQAHTLDAPEMTRRVDAPVGPLTGTTMTFAAITLAVAAVVAAQRGRRWKATGAEIGAALLAVACTISTVAAGQRRLALNGSIDFLAIVVFFLTLRQLLTSAWRVRLALCVVLATGAVFAHKCIVQVYIELPDTIAMYQREQLAAGVNQDAGKRFDFEQRMKSLLATGYFTQSNVAGSYLALIVLASAAVIIARRRRGPRLVLVAPAAVGLLAAFALTLTRSRGATIALIASALLWLIWSRAQSRWRSAARRGLVVFWMLAALALFGVATLGIVRNGLPSESMLFRWHYWRGATAMVQDHHWPGVGAENFGRLYPRYKPVEGAEEVQDPHSWIVRGAAEWGLPGLLALVIMWIGISRRLTQPVVAASAATQSFDGASERSTLAWLGGIGLLVGATYFAVYRDAMGHAEHIYFVVQNMLGIAVTGAISFILLSLETRDPRRLDDSPLAEVAPGLVAAAIAFLTHAAIDLALFSPGAATSFFALLAIALAARDGSAVTRETPGRFAPRFACASAFGALAAGVVWFGVIPTCSAGANLTVARDRWTGALRDAAKTPGTARPTPELLRACGALDGYLAARDADPYDSAALDELLGEWLAERMRGAWSAADLTLALGWIDELEARDRFAASASGYAARVHHLRYEAGHDVEELRAAAVAARRFMETYPTLPQRRIIYGRMLADLADATHDPVMRAAAAEQLREALRFDTLRVYISKPNHLGDELRAAVAAQIETLSRP